MAAVANKYARAFADVIVADRLDASRALGGLRILIGLMQESPELRRVWENPAVPAEQKRGLLDAIAQRAGIERHVRNLVSVLIDHRRIHFLNSIADRLQKELDTRLGIAAARITSARELADAERRTLETQIAKLTGKKVRAQFELDASLLGGAVVRLGSTIYDGSVKGQLERIKQTISS